MDGVAVAPAGGGTGGGKGAGDCSLAVRSERLAPAPCIAVSQLILIHNPFQRSGHNRQSTEFSWVKRLQKVLTITTARFCRSQELAAPLHSTTLQRGHALHRPHPASGRAALQATRIRPKTLGRCARGCRSGERRQRDVVITRDSWLQRELLGDYVVGE